MLKLFPISLLIASVGLFSCSSPPPVLTTSKVLVTHSSFNHYREIPEKYWQLLDDKAVDSQFSFDDRKVLLKEKYTSALGKTCRRLLVSFELENDLIPIGKRVEKRIVCKHSETTAWFLIPAIVEQKTDQTLFLQ